MVAGKSLISSVNTFRRHRGLIRLQFWRSGNSSQATASDPGAVPDEWLNADIKQGISESDVESRRKRAGWNEITTEKENLFIKFLMFFTGPILYSKLNHSPQQFAESNGSYHAQSKLSCQRNLQSLTWQSLSYGRKKLGPAWLHVLTCHSYGSRCPSRRWSP